MLSVDFTDGSWLGLPEPQAQPWMATMTATFSYPWNGVAQSVSSGPQEVALKSL